METMSNSLVLGEGANEENNVLASFLIGLTQFSGGRRMLARVLPVSLLLLLLSLLLSLLMEALFMVVIATGCRLRSATKA